MSIVKIPRIQPHNGPYDHWLMEPALEAIDDNFAVVTAMKTQSYATRIDEGSAGSGVTIDGVLLKDGSVSCGTLVARMMPIAVQQALSGPGDITITQLYTAFTSTGTGNALTLADATVIGHTKRIKYVAEAGGSDTGVLTPTHFGASTTITFNAVGDEVELVWDGAKWVCVYNSGCTIA